jgi:3-(methylthio)propanoyl-CoA dehydrogenase
MSYRAPIKEMMFAMRELANIDAVSQLPGFEDAGAETAQAVLEECAKFNEAVVAPLNWPGDINPSSWANGVVTTTAGFSAAFKQFGDGGWQGVQHPAEYGGQQLPKLIGTPCIEMLNSANLSFALCPLLTDGAIEALMTAGTDSQKQQYAPNLISGKWTGTMNLTEPQAGSDLAMVRTKAVPEPDGSYRVFGQKIYITFGEHDMAENIIHLVLARTPGAPEGVKGISLFIVPKFLINAGGSLGKRNDVYCASIEHKLGIKASPTAVLIYGDDKGAVGAGAIGYLIGEENRGLEYMFVMMNAARFAVGMQGVAVAERAYQKAVGYARDRVQSRDVAGSSGPVSIIHHPDVRRMLMTMRAHTEGARGLAYVAAAASDAGHYAADEMTRTENMAVYEFLVPIVKGWSTEMSLEVTSLGVQVHGGMGFIEETGAAQYYRDARILTIYEGTTAIQANDLIGRKTARDGGKTAKALIAQVRLTEQTLMAATGTYSDDLKAISKQLSKGSQALEDVVVYITASYKTDIKAVFAGSVPYLNLAGLVLCGWQMARAASIAAGQLLEVSAGGANEASTDTEFLKAKIATARFYADHILSRASGIRSSVVDGASGVLAMAEAQF